MGAVHVKTVNDRLLNLDYTDPEIIKQCISNWSMMESLALRGDTVASAIMIDLQRAIGVNISEIEIHKKAGLRWKREKSALTEPQFISIVYCLGLGYSHKEIAYVLGCERQAVDTHINKGVKRICRFLEGRVKGEEDKKEVRGCGGSVVKGTRPILYRKKKRKGKRHGTPISNPGSRGAKTKKRDTY